MAVGSKESTFTVSENVRVMFPVLASRMKLIRFGGVVSGVYWVVLVASLDDTSLTLLLLISLTAVGRSDIKVSPAPVARFQ